MKCQWQGCRYQRRQLTTWPNGASAWHCDEHHEAVLWSLAHRDVMPNLTDEQRAGVMAAIKRGRDRMQRIVDKGGITRVTVRFGDEPEVVMAEKRVR